jgi:polyhydroxybutyrate depolymerase
MQKVTSPLLSVLAVACFGMPAAACARGDLVLGELWRFTAEAGSGAAGIAAGSGGSPTAGGGGMAVGQAGSDAVSGSDVAGAGGVGAPAPAGTGGPVAGARAPNPVTRPSSGCGKEPVANDTSIVVMGTRSNYLLDLPTGYDKMRAYPLIIAFRGMSATVQQFRAELNLASVAPAEALVVYPNPLNETVPWEFTRDVPLAMNLLAKLKAGNCVDEDRVFALGDGAGSLFVNLVGCVMADQVRAIAPLEGAPRPPGPCLGNTAVWLVQGNAEPMTLGANLDNRDFWVGRNSCARMSMPVAPAGCVEYTGCDAGFPVRYCEHDGDGLPGFAASGVWAFFQAL